MRWSPPSCARQPHRQSLIISADAISCRGVSRRRRVKPLSSHSSSRSNGESTAAHDGAGKTKETVVAIQLATIGEPHGMLYRCSSSQPPSSASMRKVPWRQRWPTCRPRLQSCRCAFLASSRGMTPFDSNGALALGVVRIKQYLSATVVTGSSWAAQRASPSALLFRRKQLFDRGSPPPCVSVRRHRSCWRQCETPRSCAACCGWRRSTIGCHLHSSANVCGAGCNCAVCNAAPSLPCLLSHPINE